MEADWCSLLRHRYTHLGPSNHGWRSWVLVVLDYCRTQSHLAIRKNKRKTGLLNCSQAIHIFLCMALILHCCAMCTTTYTRRALFLFYTRDGGFCLRNKDASWRFGLETSSSPFASVVVLATIFKVNRVVLLSSTYLFVTLHTLLNNASILESPSVMSDRWPRILYNFASPRGH